MEKPWAANSSPAYGAGEAQASGDGGSVKDTSLMAISRGRSFNRTDPLQIFYDTNLMGEFVKCSNFIIF